MTGVGSRLMLAAVVALLVTAAGSRDRAYAAFPGENGRFVFTWFFVPPEDVDTDVIATTNSRGENFRVLTPCDYGCHHKSADWTPSGRRLVYVSAYDVGGTRLEILRPDGTQRKVVHSGGFLSSPVWSPDARRIAFIEYHWLEGQGDWVSDIYIIDRDGTDLRRVTHTRSRSEEDLDWSSRNRLVFRRSGGRFSRTRYELFTIRPNGSGLRPLTSNAVPDEQPDWGPGGWRLTFVRGNEIWKMSASGENASMVASGHSPAWGPDGSLIAFVGMDGAIHTVRPSGRDETFIGDPVDEGRIYELDWQPR